MFAIVTDAASDLSAPVAEAESIVMVSQPSPDVQPASAEFARAFAQCVADGASRIVCVTMSAGISSSYLAAKSAAQKVKHDAVVEVIDSHTFSAGEQFVLRSLLASRHAGKGFAEAVETARQVAEAVQMYIVTTPDANMLRSVHRGLAKRAYVAFSAWSGEYVMVRVADGKLQEAGRSKDLRMLTGRIVRNMSSYSQKAGELRYIEATSGNEALLYSFDKALHTNEFDSVCEDVIHTQDVVSSQAGFGAIVLAYAPATALNW